MVKFTRQYNLDRHARAKKQREFFEKVSGQKQKYSDFLKNDTPLEKNLLAFTITFGMDYMNSRTNREFSITQQSFTVYSINGYNNLSESKLRKIIIEKSFGEKEGKNFNTTTQAQMKVGKLAKSFTIAVQPRGIEDMTKEKNKDVLNKYIESGQLFYSDELPEKLEIVSKSSNRGERKTNMKIKKDDLNEFLK